ncbi:molecular chaperone HtpG [Methylococcus capsulatus]|jgi:molecular chaperone HtpG|uniref:Chaperone protein HtpG n=1 Tax=Methylococcus capsulatus TaxID=414 RepID=A0AA35XXA9_METCP|nr:molecular chaperone HtpG [Methylococcus capsulatus]CAI8741300.1 chaperone protein HtpG [Methylococcus capsulatus]
MTEAENRVTLGFEAEVKQLLHLMIHSLYGNKEIFLRELISNASDAADKLRFSALGNDALYEGDSRLRVRIEFDKAARTLSISDNGIGMTREEVQHNIGTIARSGTRHFFESLTGDEAKDSQLIGQFGVGFYSAFIVADKVVLETRKAGVPAEEGARWESSGEGSYTLETLTRPERGTRVTLHLREGEDEFLDGWKLRAIIRKFSDHISLPIEMKRETGEPKEGEEAPAEVWETVNSASALWAKNRDEITDEAYNEFYKHVSHDFQEPLARVHSRVEGTNEYTLLLYIPKHAPFDLWDRDSKRGVKLYVRKVFIMEDSDKLMPRYLRFVRGVIDSDSLPLNVSREILQENKQLEKIRGGAVKKVLGLLEDLANNEPEKYQAFWKEFGQVLKEGLIEDFANKDRLAKLLRFSSTHTDSEEQTVTLDEYVSRMKEGQDKIYFVSAESFGAARNSPHLEIFRKKDIEVLLLSDRIDEWLVSYLTEYEGKPLQSVARGDLDLGKLEGEEEKAEAAAEKEAFAPLTERLKKALEAKVNDVRLSHRLTDSPACLISESYGMSRTMERIMKSAGQNIPGSKPILEINPHHGLIARLNTEADQTRFQDLASLLLDQAVLAEGGQLDDPAEFVHKLNGLLQSLL